MDHLLDTWPVMALGDICEISSNQIQPSSFGKYDNYIGLEDIEKDTGRIISYQPVEEANLKSSKFEFNKSSILFGKLRPYLRKVALPNVTGICSTDILPLKPNEAIVCREYVYFFLRTQSVTSWVTEKSTGANLPRISPALLLQIKVPIPPIEVQKKISKTLMKTQELRQSREQANQIIERILRAAFMRIFGDPFANPHSFPTASIQECVDLVNGKAFKPSDWAKDGLKIIRIQNLNNQFAEFNYYPKEIEDKYVVNRGDLLLSWSGTPGTSFGAFIWRGEKAALNQHIFNVKIKLANLNKYFLQYFIDAKLSELIWKAHGGVGLQHITKSELNKITVFIPPISLQQDFSAIVERVEVLRQKQTQATNEIQALFESLMSKAFRGMIS